MFRASLAKLSNCGYGWTSILAGKKIKTLIDPTQSHFWSTKKLKLESASDPTTSPHKPFALNRISFREFKTTACRLKEFESLHQLRSASKSAREKRKQEVDTFARAAVEKVYHIMQYSEDLEYQRQNINRHLVGCLPINSSEMHSDNTPITPKFCPMYFNDVTEDNYVMKQLKEEIRSSCATDLQRRTIVNMVQARGTGKSHLAVQYSKLHGGIVISFANGIHEELLMAAKTIIQKNQPRPIDGDDVASLNDELAYLDSSIRIMSLIPLTFIQFASSFYPIAREYFRAKNPSLDDTLLKLRVREAFLRATLDAKTTDLLQLFRSNVELYGDLSPYQSFFHEMKVNARREEITAIFYDEISELKNHCRGLFCHERGEDYSSDNIIARLKLERQNFKNGINAEVEAHSFSRDTSLMYLQVFVMEDLVRSNIACVTCSSSYTAVCYPLFDGSPYSGSRLHVTHFAPYETSETRLNRAISLLTTAFGPEVKEELKQHELALKYLSSRSVYLWNLFKKIKDHSTLNNTIAAAVHEAQESAQFLANLYFSRLDLIHKDIKDACVKIWRGENFTLSRAALVEGVRAGAIITRNALDSRYYKKQNNKEVPEHWPSTIFDSFVQQQMIFAISLDRPEDYCPLILQKSKNKPVLSIYGPAKIYSLRSDVLGLRLPPFMLPNTLVPLNIKEDYELFEKFPHYHSVYYQPSPALNLSATVHLFKDKQPAGFMLIHAKNNEDIMTPSGFIEALTSLEPSKFYSRSKNKRKKWHKIMRRQKLRQLHWVRLVYAKKFSDSVVTVVYEYNHTRVGMKYPIVLMSPHEGWVNESTHKNDPQLDRAKQLSKLMKIHFDQEKFTCAKKALKRLLLVQE